MAKRKQSQSRVPVAAGGGSIIPRELSVSYWMRRVLDGESFVDEVPDVMRQAVASALTLQIWERAKWALEAPAPQVEARVEQLPLTIREQVKRDVRRMWGARKAK